MQLEQSLYVKTKKKETLKKVIDLLEKYGPNTYDINDYKNLTFSENIYVDYEIFKHIHQVIEKDGVMVYMETDSCRDPYTDMTYNFGDGVKGEYYEDNNLFYRSITDDWWFDNWIKLHKIKLTQKEYDRITSLGLKGKNIELAIKKSKNK